MLSQLPVSSALLAAACAAAAAQPARGVRPAPSPLTVCEVLSQPLFYDGHLLTVRARIAGTDEGAYLAGDNCPTVPKTEGHLWPEVIFLAMPDSHQPGPPRPVDFEFDWESKRHVDSRYRQLRKRAPDECIVFTVTGLFETRRDWSAAKVIYPNGTWTFVGFGHLGEALGQLVMRSEDDVALAPNCAPPARVR